MRTTKIREVLAAGLLVATLSLLPGCGGGGGGGGGGAANPNPNNQVDFQTFVRDQIQNRTADDTDPVEINDLVFQDQLVEDETAFDSLIN